MIDEKSNIHQLNDQRDDSSCGRENKSSTRSSESRMQYLTSCMMEQREGGSNFYTINDCDGNREMCDRKDTQMMGHHLIKDDTTACTVPHHHKAQEQQRTSMNVSRTRSSESRMQYLASCMIKQREGGLIFYTINDCDGNRETCDRKDYLMMEHRLIKDDTTACTVPHHHKFQEQQRTSMNIYLSDKTLKKHFKPDDVKSL